MAEGSKLSVKAYLQTLQAGQGLKTNAYAYLSQTDTAKDLKFNSYAYLSQTDTAKDLKLSVKAYLTIVTGKISQYQSSSYAYISPPSFRQSQSNLVSKLEPNLRIKQYQSNIVSEIVEAGQFRGYQSNMVSHELDRESASTKLSVKSNLSLSNDAKETKLKASASLYPVDPRIMKLNTSVYLRRPEPHVVLRVYQSNAVSMYEGIPAPERLESHQQSASTHIKRGPALTGWSQLFHGVVEFPETIRQRQLSATAYVGEKPDKFKQYSSISASSIKFEGTFKQRSSQFTSYIGILPPVKQYQTSSIAEIVLPGKVQQYMSFLISEISDDKFRQRKSVSVSNVKEKVSRQHSSEFISICEPQGFIRSRKQSGVVFAEKTQIIFNQYQQNAVANIVKDKFILTQRSGNAISEIDVSNDLRQYSSVLNSYIGIVQLTGLTQFQQSGIVHFESEFTRQFKSLLVAYIEEPIQFRYKQHDCVGVAMINPQFVPDHTNKRGFTS